MTAYPSAASAISESNVVLRHTENALTQIFQRTEDPRERLAGLDEEISRVERVLSRLRSFQPTLRRDINRLHSPILQILPTELVSEIFTHCLPNLGDFSPHLPPSDGSICPLLLGSICSSWRQIAWATPSLWTSPTLLLCKPKLRIQAELLEEWIGRSGDLTLTLRLLCGSDDDRVTDIPQGLFKTILRHASRWRAIDLQIPTAYYENLSAPEATFSSLRRLIVNPSGGQGDRSHILEWSNCTPQLRDISLFSVYLNAVRVRWDNITRVHAKAFYIDECLEFMKRTPRLENCTFYSVIRGDDGHSLPRDPISVPDLQTLTLVTERSVDGGAILNKIFAPGLKNLTYDVAERPFHIPTFREFVERSHAHLTTLSILRAVVSSADVMEILALIPTVVEFKLNVIEAQGQCLGYGVMAMLIPDDRGHCALPNMTRFEYVGAFSFSWPQMVAMLIARRGLKRLPTTNSLSMLDRVDVVRNETHLLYPKQSVAVLKHVALRLKESPDDIELLDFHQYQNVRQLIADGLELTIHAATLDFLDRLPGLTTRATNLLSNSH
ncbi:hypothetical protein CC2G_001241 [Coprinopsis cinerea AmutBmut pab1-1]|nr:hypothetical protein CC2G_001241 [Coprinopsis cinerea AmutBmut pab1-1]